ncbi:MULTISPECIES: hypothetical protein [Tenacibaculum]|uniref:hypothetical protein n=1 Tax=Tenacibaculum TaxID=104267 RepID=UPI0021AE35CB|nr:MULTISPECIES: hypothetical protein [Tenacibaculum]MCT4698608.1 hypothetical protein [Tenacibaculum haliotis]WBX72282.1 hypothetical protein PG912_05955 [Tenacibaculum retecalamus]
MKKLFFIATLFLSVASYSQIELIETARVEIVGRVEFVYLEKIGDEAYNLFYKNINNPINEYVSFTFKNVDNDADKLHQIMVRGFEEAAGSKYQIKANGDVVYLKYERDEGVIKLQIEQYVSREPDVLTESKLLTLDEINKLFRK